MLQRDQPCDCETGKPGPGQADECAHGHDMCQKQQEGSYCKYDQDKPTCAFTNKPCHCQPKASEIEGFGPPPPKDDSVCKYGDDMCTKGDDGVEGSYCKYWDAHSVCHMTNKPCHCTPKDPKADEGACFKGDQHCQKLNGDNSYCEWWQEFSVCEGGNQPCDCEAGVPSPDDTDECAHGHDMCQKQQEGSYCKYDQEKPVCAYTNKPCHCKPKAEDFIVSKPGDDENPCKHGDDMCSKGPEGTEGSYCRYWDTHSVCQGTNRPCHCDPKAGPKADQGVCFTGDDHCKKLNGDGSYCEFWQEYSVCSGGNQPCDCESGKPEPGPGGADECAHGHDMCQKQQEGSYCKYDQEKPVCAFTNKPCHCKPKASELMAPQDDGPCKHGDDMCSKDGNEGSYCKYWDTRSTCFGSGKPCHCEPKNPAEGNSSCYKGDDFCKKHTGNSDSYCEFWQEYSVCHGTNNPCSCEGGPTPGGADECAHGHDMCEKQQEGSYCKYDQEKPTCAFTNKPCHCKPKAHTLVKRHLIRKQE